MNLNVQSGGQAQLVSLASVENVNARLLESGPGSALALNAIDWAGVTTLSFNNSLDETAVRVSGLTTEASIAVQREVDVSVDFRALTSGADTVSLTLTSAGSGGGTAASLTTAGVADIDVDLDDAGLIDTLNVNLAAGTNYATLEAGADLRTLNITGAGNAYLSTNDQITSLDASAAAGNLDITLSGASDVVAKGGAGNDTLRLGTSFSNSDSFDGGSGSDTIAATVGSFSRNLKTTNVETATISFADANGGELNTTGSTVTTYNLRAISASADIVVNGIIDGATVNLTASADAADAVSLDAATGAQTMTIVAGSASGSVAIDLLTVTDVANVTLNNVAGTATNAGTLTIATASFDSDTRSVAVNAVTGTGAIAFTDLLVGGATAVTITSNASGGITLGTGISGSALKSVSLVQNGSANIVGETIEGSGLTSITLDANGGGNIYLADTGAGIELGNNSTGSTQASVTVSMNAETNSDVGTAVSGASGVAINTTGSIALALNIDASQASAGVHAGIITVALGGASAETTGTTLTVSAGSLGTGSIVRTETINIDGMTGTQVVVGAVTQGVSSTFVLASGGIDATNVENVDLSALTMTLGVSAIAQVGAVTTTAGAHNGITVSVDQGGSAIFGAIVASAVGAMSMTVASGAEIDVGAILTSGSAAGSIVGAVGSIELNGSDAGDVTFGTIGASAVGAIAVSGALDVTFGTITANRIGVIDTTQQGASGTFTIDLSGVSAAAELTLGAGTNVVISGKGNDSITLLAGRTGAAGNDNIQYGTASQGTDQIANFIGGAAVSGGDQIEFDVSVFSTGILDADGSAIAAAEAVVFGNASGAAVTLGASANIILFTTAYASTAALITDAAADITLSTGTLRSADFFAVWTDGTDSYVSQIHIEEGASATVGIIALASASGITVTTFATLTNVSAGALVAANFAFV